MIESPNCTARHGAEGEFGPFCHDPSELHSSAWITQTRLCFSRTTCADWVSSALPALSNIRHLVFQFLRYKLPNDPSLGEFRSCSSTGAAAAAARLPAGLTILRGNVAADRCAWRSSITAAIRENELYPLVPTMQWWSSALLLYGK